MTRLSIKTGLLALVAALLLGSPSVSQEGAASGYRIKRSTVAVPLGVPLGQYRRSIRPFQNWTLICDENLEGKRKICNVTQVIEDAFGNVAFSWSLAANMAGKPYMILRVPAAARSFGKVTLSFPNRELAIHVRFVGCDEDVCIGQVPVGPILRLQIKREVVTTISYATSSASVVSVPASLSGLRTALDTIN